MSPDNAILVINSGSSSLKFAIFASDPALSHLYAGAVERIGIGESRFHVEDKAGTTVLDVTENIVDHTTALARVLAALEERLKAPRLCAVGHRVVHGGEDCDCPLPVTEALEERLTRLIPLAPLHLPPNLAGIVAVRQARPDLPQIASFDTAFHHGLPRLAQLVPLSRELRESGIRRYGFHGLSYEYVVDHLRRDGVDIEAERVIVAHLGNGASMCALHQGRSVETTMGFSTISGLMMGTRCGDVDPGVVLYLLKQAGLSVDQVDTLLYQRSGLLGISGFSGDMRELLGRQDDPAAREAVDLFCYRARHHLAALTAVLGGLDRLVFTGGIGANAPEVRARICGNLRYLGVVLDSDANSAGRRIVSEPKAAVTVEIVSTDEELVIARHVRRLIAARRGEIVVAFRSLNEKADCFRPGRYNCRKQIVS